MLDATHSAVMKRNDLEEVPYNGSDYVGTHVQLSESSISDKSSFWPTLFATLVVALGPLNFGFALGYTSPVEQKMEASNQSLYLNKDEFSWFAVSLFL